MHDFLAIVFTAEFVGNALKYATPLLLASLGLVVNERSGVMNLSVEGMILSSAFFAFAGSYFTGSPLLGLLAALLASLLIALVHSYCCISLGLNQVIVAVALNTFCLGLTSTLFRIFLGTDTNVIRANGFSFVRWPKFLTEIPVLGEILLKQHIFTYVALIMIFVIWWIFYKTTWGLEIRAVGEYPRAADTMGVKVYKVRYLAMLFSSLMAGMAGTALSITGLNLFIDNMSAGYGFIAFATIVFGRFHPLGVTGGALMFGFAQSLQIRMQISDINIPYQIPIMLPYLLTIVMLGIIGSGSVPASWCIPYFPDEE